VVCRCVWLSTLRFSVGARTPTRSTLPRLRSRTCGSTTSLRYLPIPLTTAYQLLCLATNSQGLEGLAACFASLPTIVALRSTLSVVEEVVGHCRCFASSLQQLNADRSMYDALAKATEVIKSKQSEPGYSAYTFCHTNMPAFVQHTGGDVRGLGCSRNSGSLCLCIQPSMSTSCS
jgi:hypothetical protein